MPELRAEMAAAKCRLIVCEATILSVTSASPELTHAHPIADYAGMMIVTTLMVARAV